MHAHLSRASSKCAFLSFGRELFYTVGMIFGLTISPYKFQQCNRVLINAMITWGFMVLLYLDDRLSYAHTTRPLTGIVDLNYHIYFKFFR